MKRGGILAAIALTLSACRGGAATTGPAVSTTGPAVYAQLRPPHATCALDVWRDSQGRLTFRCPGDTPGEVSRYDPSTFAWTGIRDGKAVAFHRYSCKRDAWKQIRADYGVTESDVSAALASGKPSPEPVGFRVADWETDEVGSSDYSYCGDYGP